MKIAVIGSLSQDTIIIPKRGEKYSQTGGGVYYSSLALASLGVDVVALPLLAEKDADLLKSLHHPKITILPQWTKETTVYENTYPEETMDVCQKKNLSRAWNFQISDDAGSHLADCRAVHLVPLSTEEFHPALFKLLRKNYEGQISLDGQGFTIGACPNLPPLLKNNIDIIKVDEEEALRLSSQKNEQAAVDVFKNWGIAEILVTKASRGSVVYVDGAATTIPAHPPGRIVDATGCGDAYIAGYLAKRLMGIPPLEAAHFASQIAAQNLEHKGALRKAPSI